MSEEGNQQAEKKNLYNQYYKLLLILPAIFLIFSIVYLINFNSKNGDVVYKDVSLTGGTTITVFDKEVDIQKLKLELKNQFSDIIVRSISDIRTGSQQAFFVETSAEPEEIKQALEDYLNYDLDLENSSVEFSGASLSAGFYKQLRSAILIAFLFMAIVVFFIFRTPIPSLAVIVSAFAGIVFTIVVLDILKIPFSIGGIIGLLMLIGYSVDTDILLTTRVLKRAEGTINQKIFGAFKTGMTMTLTSIVAVAVSLIIIYNLSETLKQIFTIILVGLSFDIFNTWITNASIIKWYAEVKRI